MDVRKHTRARADMEKYIKRLKNFQGGTKEQQDGTTTSKGEEEFSDSSASFVIDFHLGRTKPGGCRER